MQKLQSLLFSEKKKKNKKKKQKKKNKKNTDFVNWSYAESTHRVIKDKVSQYFE